jgi:signal transduction histidine kinase
MPHIIVLFVLAVAVALVERLWRVAVVWLGSAVVFGVLMPPEDRGGLVLGVTAAMVVGLLLRWLILSRVQLARQQEVTELERTRRTVLEERSRIARDLHDVVAHRMSLVVVQAQSASARLASVPPEVADEFTSISQQAREALNEVRGMLGVLRGEDTTAASVPQQGTRDVEPLLRQTRGAGVDLTWTVDGEPATVGAVVGMVVYRILQEALANASRHAPGSRIEVDIEFGDPVQVTIRSGPSAGRSATGGGSVHPGTGIIGMSERARSVGGRLDAHPLPDGGFLVCATLPATARATH